eukprot:jgi/Mesvir1/23289/Mv20991-RA.1
MALILEQLARRRQNTAPWRRPKEGMTRGRGLRGSVVAREEVAIPPRLQALATAPGQSGGVHSGGWPVDGSQEVAQAHHLGRGVGDMGGDYENGSDNEDNAGGSDDDMRTGNTHGGLPGGCAGPQNHAGRTEQLLRLVRQATSAVKVLQGMLPPQAKEGRGRGRGGGVGVPQGEESGGPASGVTVASFDGQHGGKDADATLLRSGPARKRRRYYAASVLPVQAP